MNLGFMRQSRHGPGLGSEALAAKDVEGGDTYGTDTGTDYRKTPEVFVLIGGPGESGTDCMKKYVYWAVGTHATILLVLAGTVIVMVLPILNGGPFFYFDTPSYIEQTAKIVSIFFPATPDVEGVQLAARVGAQTFGSPEGDRIVFGGRSVYYGFFAYLGWVTDIWLPVIVQSLTLSWLVIMLFRHTFIPQWEYKALLVLALLALFSSASLFAGLIMPDIWVGFLVLALSLFWTFGHRLSRGTKGALFLVLVFAVLIHNSHLALLAVMIACFIGLRILPSVRARARLGLLVIPLMAAGIGIAGQVAYSSAVRAIYGADLLQRPFLTAHLTDLGPGTRLVQQTCPASGFALCAFADRLPVDWIDFLFDTNPDAGVFAVAPPLAQKALAEEQVAFALQTLRAEPLATLAGLAGDGVSQLWTISINDVALSHQNEGYIRRNLPPDLIDRLKRTQIYTTPELTAFLLRIVQITSALSAVVLVSWAIVRIGRRAARDEETRAMDSVIFILVAGLFLNALICGMLASPYGRFQARIIWILPLVAALILTKSPFMSLWRNSNPVRVRE